MDPLKAPQSVTRPTPLLEGVRTRGRRDATAPGLSSRTGIPSASSSVTPAGAHSPPPTPPRGRPCPVPSPRRQAPPGAQRPLPRRRHPRPNSPGRRRGKLRHSKVTEQAPKRRRPAGSCPQRLPERWAAPLPPTAAEEAPPYGPTPLSRSFAPLSRSPPSPQGRASAGAPPTLPLPPSPQPRHPPSAPRLSRSPRPEQSPEQSSAPPHGASPFPLHPRTATPAPAAPPGAGLGRVGLGALKHGGGQQDRLHSPARGVPPQLPGQQVAPAGPPCPTLGRPTCPSRRAAYRTQPALSKSRLPGEPRRGREARTEPASSFILAASHW